MPDQPAPAHSHFKSFTVCARVAKNIGLLLKDQVKTQLAERRIIKSEPSCITETLDAGVDRLIHALATKPGELTAAEQRLGEALAKYRIDVRRKF
jgi:hypothetical protein